MTKEDNAQLGWVILYVPDPGEAIALYERAFGMSRRFVAEGNSYAELDTGSTTLAFASTGLGEGNFEGGVQQPDLSARPFNVELALVFDRVETAFARAVEHGCIAVSEPARKPQGQTVGWVRDPFGNLIEIASPLDNG